MMVQSLCAQCIHGRGKDHRCLRKPQASHRGQSLHWHKCKHYGNKEEPELYVCLCVRNGGEE